MAGRTVALVLLARPAVLLAMDSGSGLVWNPTESRCSQVCANDKMQKTEEGEKKKRTGVRCLLSKLPVTGRGQEPSLKRDTTDEKRILGKAGWPCRCFSVDLSLLRPTLVCLMPGTREELIMREET